jgi:hypothetical protein
VEEHHARTGSQRAAALLSDWEEGLAGFRQVVPLASLVAAAPEPAPVAEAATDTSEPAAAPR